MLFVILIFKCVQRRNPLIQNLAVSNLSNNCTIDSTFNLTHAINQRDKCLNLEQILLKFKCKGAETRSHIECFSVT